MGKPSESPSWYRATARAPRTYPSLAGELAADVCIIGAGYTGLSAALELATAGRRVIVLEAERVGFGGSGRNGGQICTGFSPGQGAVRAQVGREDAHKCFALAEEAKTLIEERIRTHRIECDLTWGYLHCAPKPSKVRDLHELQEEWLAEGYRDLQVAEQGRARGEARHEGLFRGAARGPGRPFPPPRLLPRAGPRGGGRGRGNLRAEPRDALRYGGRAQGVHVGRPGQGQIHDHRLQRLCRPAGGQALLRHDAGNELRGSDGAARTRARPQPDPRQRGGGRHQLGGRLLPPHRR